jgi:hypothetical protein
MNDKYYHIGLWRYAKEFYCAARKLGDEDKLSIVVYYLYCHAIELVFKSALVFCGFEERDLKKIGHDLIKAWRKVEEVEPDLFNKLWYKEKTKKIINIVNSYYRGKEFEYIKKGAKRFPTLQEVRDVIEELLLVIGKYINIPDTQLNKLLHQFKLKYET